MQGVHYKITKDEYSFKSGIKTKNVLKLAIGYCRKYNKVRKKKKLKKKRQGSPYLQIIC